MSKLEQLFSKTPLYMGVLFSQNVQPKWNVVTAQNHNHASRQGSVSLAMGQ